MYRTIVIKNHLLLFYPAASSEYSLILGLDVRADYYFCMYDDGLFMYIIMYKSMNKNYIKAIDISALVICAYLGY